MDFQSIAPLFINPSPTRADDSTPVNPKRSAGRPKGSKNKLKTPLPQEKKPVGRPKGSKNMPSTTKSLESMAKDSETVLYIPAGVNIAKWLLDYCHNHHASLTVLNATGELADVASYNQPNSSIPGPFPILAFSCTVVPTPSYDPTNLEETSFPMFVSLFSLNGDIVCNGMEAKSATAASIVRLVVKMTALCNSIVDVDDTVCNDLRTHGVTLREYCNNPYNVLENVQPVCDNYSANIGDPYDEPLDKIDFWLKNMPVGGLRGIFSAKSIWCLL